MSRLCRVLRVCMAGALIVATFTPARPALASEAAYEHVWQAQGLFYGETGATRQRVLGSSLTLSREGDRFTGRLEYHDLLGISTGAPTVLSQEAEMTLVLTGEALDAGTAGGTFDGTVTLTTRSVGSLEDALGPAEAATADALVYDVTGHWGAELSAGRAEGELLFETAVPQADAAREPADPRAPAWFNRGDLSEPDGLGSAQAFDVALGTGESTDDDSQADAGDAGTPDPVGEQDAGPDGTADAASVWTYILRGLAGGTTPSQAAVPAEQAAAARALRDARPARATELPANALTIDLEVPGAYLDAKNRATGLLDDGPVFEGAGEARASAEELRAGAPGIPALPPGVDAGEFWATYGATTLAGERVGGVPGATELAEELAAVTTGLDADEVAGVRARTMSVLAVAGASFGSVLEGAAASARHVGRAPISGFGRAAAVLAAFRDPGAPVASVEVERFERDADRDVRRDGEFTSPDPRSVPASLAAISGSTAVSFARDGERSSADPEVWLAYRRDDGRAFWLAGEGGPVALTDGSLVGWAFESRRAALVSADDIGSVLAYFRTR